MKIHSFPLVALAIVAAACEQTPSQPSIALSASTLGKFDAIPGSAHCVAPPATAAGFDSYQPFVLPAGNLQRIVASQVNDFTPVAGGRLLLFG